MTFWNQIDGCFYKSTFAINTKVAELFDWERESQKSNWFSPIFMYVYHQYKKKKF